MHVEADALGELDECFRSPKERFRWEGHLKLDKATSGLGTIIVEALAKQRDARVETTRNLHGTTVSITHGMSDLAWPRLTGCRRLPKSNGGSVAAI